MKYLTSVIILISVAEALIPPSCRVQVFEESRVPCEGEPVGGPSSLEILYNWLGCPCGDNVYEDELFECCVHADFFNFGDNVDDDIAGLISNRTANATFVHIECEYNVGNKYLLCGWFLPVEAGPWLSVAIVLLAFCLCVYCGYQCRPRSSKTAYAAVETSDLELKGFCKLPTTELTIQ